MSKNLVIVESPAKAKTIQKFIGNDFDVISSKGHVRDLPNKELGIDLVKNFTPKYEIMNDKKALIAEIKRRAKEAETVWLATDDDREGEAISWHLMEVANIAANKVKRIVFHEITKQAVENALAHPRNIDIDLVNAQQARRILDRIVGFELSPVLWRKVKPQLSAGRVQSVAVKLIVEREHEIQQFQTSSSYRITGNFTEVGRKFELEADLNKKYENKEEVKKFLEHCKNASYHIAAVEKSPGKKSPSAPFTTSTLQQEASRKLGFSVSKTMVVAQQLYEAGYITYMRTDSVNLSEVALADIREQIVENWGEEYYKKRKYSVKSKNAQEAHEAIRPTSMARKNVATDTFAKRLYELIWKRTIASQMNDAKTEKTTITIPVSGREEKFMAIGEVVIFQGFLKVYIESKDEEDEEVKGLLPPVTIGDALHYTEIKATQKYSQPPTRFTEASLVKRLEELGIGRPSTYAPTISTVLKREYVVKENRDGSERTFNQLLLKDGALKEEVKKEKFGYEKDKLFPTDMGTVVNQYLQENFENIMDYGFTAEVEKQFDDIAEGSVKWQEMLDKFYSGFHHSVDDALVNSSKASGERLLGQDTASEKNVYVKLGKFGPMVQMGDSSDEEKPKYARLKSTQSIDTITFEEAMELFKLPRKVGEYENKEVSIGIGRFGPYIRFNNQFISIPKGEEPLEISLERTIELIEQKRKTDQDRAPRSLGEHEGKEIFVAVGRFGPYIKYDEQNTTLDKGINVSALTLEQAVDLLLHSKTRNVIAAYPENPDVKVMQGRYGAYITKESSNYKIPKGMLPENLTYQEVMDIIANSTPTVKKRVVKKK